MITISGVKHWLWRAVDQTGTVLSILVQSRRSAKVAKRFFRELLVDRIWEGTSEIQRLIIARALEKRGVGRVVG